MNKRNERDRECIKKNQLSKVFLTLCIISIFLITIPASAFDIPFFGDDKIKKHYKPETKTISLLNDKSKVGIEITVISVTQDIDKFVEIFEVSAIGENYNPSELTDFLLRYEDKNKKDVSSKITSETWYYQETVSYTVSVPDYNGTVIIGYHEEIRYKDVWTELNNLKKIKKGESIIFKLVLTKKAMLGEDAILVVPTFMDTEVEEMTWWNLSWFYKFPILINNTGGDALNDYQIFVNLTNNPINETSLRVVNETAYSTVPHWCENVTDGNCNLLWFNATHIDASSWMNDTYFIYAGNDDVSSTSNGSNTFLVFDDFSDGNYDGWNVLAGTWSASSNYLTTSSTSARIQTPLNDAYVAVQFRYRMDSTAQDHYAYNPVLYTNTDNYYRFTLYSNYYDNDSRLFIMLAGVPSAIWNGNEYDDTDNWHTYNFTRDANGVFKFYRDGNYEGTVTNNDITTCSQTELGSTGESAKYWDDIIVRKYTDPEPTAQIGVTEYSITLIYGITEYNTQRKLVRTSEGYLHRVYTTNNRIYYARSIDNGNTWTETVLTAAGVNSTHPSIAGDSEDNLWVFYERENIGIRYKIYKGTSWQSEQTLTTDSGEVPVVAVDSDDNIHVSWFANLSITEYDSPDTSTRDLAWDGNYIWSCDSNTDKIYKHNADMTVNTEYDSPGTSPTGLTWDGSVIWSSDADTDKIYKHNTNMTVNTEYASPSNYSTGLAWDGSRIWSIDDDADKIYKHNVNMSVNTEYASPSVGPYGLAWDGTVIWSADTVADKIYKHNTDITVNTEYDPPSTSPAGLAWDGSRIWSADPAPDKIYKHSTTMTDGIDQIQYTFYNGTSWSSTTDITTDLIGDQKYPTIAIDSNNYIHVSFQGYNSTSRSYNIKYRKYTDSWQDVYNITSGEVYNQNFPSIVIDLNDHVHIVWETLDNKINYRKYTTAWQSVYEVCDESYPQHNPSISVYSTNDVSVTWFGKTSTYNENFIIRERHYSGSWSAITDILHPAGKNVTHPGSISALHPVFCGDCYSNIPLTGFSIVYDEDDGDIEYYNSSTWRCPDIYTLTVIARDISTNQVISNFTALLSTGETGTASYGAVKFRCLETGYYDVTVSSSLYHSAQQSIVLDMSKVVIIYLVSITEEDYYAKITHQVEFRVRDWWGNPIAGVNVTANASNITMPPSWIRELLGYGAEVDILNTTLNGFTDSSGRITFMMVQTIEYTITFVKTTQDVNETLVVYPKDTQYIIIVNPTWSYTVGDYVSWNLSTSQHNATHINLSLVYDDSILNETPSLWFYVKNENRTQVYSEHFIYNETVSVNYSVEDVSWDEYLWGFNATHTTYGTLTQDKLITFRDEDGVRVDLNIDNENYYTWFSVAILILLSTLFSVTVSRFGYIIIPFFSLFFWYIGWLAISHTLVLTALMLGVLLYIGRTEREKGL